MAKGGVTESALDEIHKETEECAICFTDYKDPRLLDCSHRFCRKCLEELKDKQHPEDKNLSCPLCRKETIMHDGDDVDGLPKVGITSKEQLLEGQGSNVICQACEEENKAISRCMDCEYYLCQECQKAHQRWTAFKSHRIGTLAELESENFSFGKSKTNDNIPKCETHPDQEVCSYCNTCEVLICNTCKLFEHREPLHSYDSIDQAFIKCSTEINKLISQTKKCIQYFISAHPVSTDHSRKRLDIMLNLTKDNISRKAENEIAKIRQNQKQLNQEAQDICTKRDKGFSFITKADSTLKKVNKIMTAERHYEALDLTKKHLHDLKELIEVYTALDINHRMSFIGFKESTTVGQLGTLLLEEKWGKKVVCEEENHLIAAYSNCDLVVANVDRKKLITLNPEGNILSKKRFCLGAQRSEGSAISPDESESADDSEKDLSDSDDSDYSEDSFVLVNPSAMSVNKDDQVIILDSPAVKIFSKEYKLIHQFTPCDDSDSKPTCLAVDDSNMIAVGYKGKKEISLHNPDGSLIRTLPAPGIDKYLVISNQHLIYSNTRECKLMCVDLDGKCIFTTDFKDKNCIPCGLCCDKAGDIYVIIKTPTKHTIGHYGANGKYIECIVDNTIQTGLVPVAAKGFSFGKPAVMSTGIPAVSRGILTGCVLNIEDMFLKGVPLNNPHGITFIPDGRLVVAQPGKIEIFCPV